MFLCSSLYRDVSILWCIFFRQAWTIYFNCVLWESQYSCYLITIRDVTASSQTILLIPAPFRPVYQSTLMTSSKRHPPILSNQYRIQTKRARDALSIQTVHVAVIFSIWTMHVAFSNLNNAAPQSACIKKNFLLKKY